MIDLSEHFYALKDYTNDFPTFVYTHRYYTICSIVTTSSQQDQQISVLASDAHPKSIRIMSDVYELCTSVAQNVHAEKKREKGIKETFSHKVGRKWDMIRACMAAMAVSIVVSLIVTVPGLGSKTFLSIPFLLHSDTYSQQRCDKYSV
jgi:hypothetical protein